MRVFGSSRCIQIETRIETVFSFLQTMSLLNLPDASKQKLGLKHLTITVNVCAQFTSRCIQIETRIETPQILTVYTTTQSLPDASKQKLGLKPISASTISASTSTSRCIQIETRIETQTTGSSCRLEYFFQMHPNRNQD